MYIRCFLKSSYEHTTNRRGRALNLSFPRKVCPVRQAQGKLWAKSNGRESRNSSFGGWQPQAELGDGRCLRPANWPFRLRSGHALIGFELALLYLTQHNTIFVLRHCLQWVYGHFVVLKIGFVFSNRLYAIRSTRYAIRINWLCFFKLSHSHEDTKILNSDLYIQYFSPTIWFPTVLITTSWYPDSPIPGFSFQNSQFSILNSQFYIHYLRIIPHNQINIKQ